VLLVVPFALAGKDPVLTLFSWFSGIAVLAHHAAVLPDVGVGRDVLPA
jgi:hypothetical protein